MRQAAFALILLMGVTGCMPLREVTLDAVDGIRPIGLDSGGLGVRADVRVTNPNGQRIVVDEPRIDLLLDGRRIGTATLDDPIVLPARHSGAMNVLFHARLDGGQLAVMGLGMLLGDRPVLRAEGSVRVRSGLLSRRIPVQLEAPLMQ